MGAYEKLKQKLENVPQNEIFTLEIGIGEV
jgi:hypothetical protein